MTTTPSQTKPAPTQKDPKHLRRLHALGREHGLSHEQLRGYVGVASLRDASVQQLQAACARLQARSQTQRSEPRGGQHSAPPPRLPRRPRRPQQPTINITIDQVTITNICVICCFPSHSNPCARCRAQEQAPPPKPPRTTIIDMGPLPRPDRPHKPTCIADIACQTLQHYLMKGEARPSSDRTITSYTGPIPQRDRDTIATYMRGIGASQQIDSWAWTYGHGDLYMSILLGRRDSFILASDKSEPPHQPPAHITAPRPRELAVGGVA